MISGRESNARTTLSLSSPSEIFLPQGAVERAPRSKIFAPFEIKALHFFVSEFFSTYESLKKLSGLRFTTPITHTGLKSPTTKLGNNLELIYPMTLGN